MTDDDCNEAIQRLYGFLDGELTAERRLQIQAHLDDCSPCLEAFDFEAELRIMIASKCRDEVPDSLRLRIATAIHQEHIRLYSGSVGSIGSMGSDGSGPGLGPMGPPGGEA